MHKAGGPALELDTRMFADNLHAALAREEYIRFWPKNTNEDLLIRLHLVYPLQPCVVECACFLYDASDAAWPLQAAHKTWILGGSRSMVLFELPLHAIERCTSSKCVVGFLPGPRQREPLDVHVELSRASQLIDVVATTSPLFWNFILPASILSAGLSGLLLARSLLMSALSILRRDSSCSVLGTLAQMSFGLLGGSIASSLLTNAWTWLLDRTVHLSQVKWTRTVLPKSVWPMTSACSVTVAPNDDDLQIDTMLPLQLTMFHWLTAHVDGRGSVEDPRMRHHDRGMPTALCAIWPGSGPSAVLLYRARATFMSQHMSSMNVSVKGAQLTRPLTTRPLTTRPESVPMGADLLQLDMFPALHALQRRRLAAEFMSVGFKELMERAWAPERVARGLVDPDH